MEVKAGRGSGRNYWKTDSRGAVMTGIPLGAALPALLVACGAAFLAGALLAFRHRAGRLAADLESAAARKAGRLRREGIPPAVAARVGRLGGDLRRILARHGLAAPPR